MMDLYLNFDFFGAIVLDETGPEWTNQCGGTMCSHPVARGHFYPLPLSWLPTPDPAEDVWIDTVHDRGAERLRQFLVANLPGAELDLEHSGPCGEAWIPVRFVKSDLCGALTGRRAVLTYVNSD